MHNVYLYSGCYTLSPNADINWYTEKLGKRALLSEDDFVTYAADKKYSKNEKIACDLLYPAAKALDIGSAGNTIAPEEIGISFGTAQGCIHSLQHAAENIKQKLFLGTETEQFLNYIDEEYPKNLSNRALSSFDKNKERDLAIIALLLASGVRLSEAVNLDLKDLNLKMMVIEVTRKGGKRDSVNVAAFAKAYLERYLEVRSKRYKAEKSDTALFLTEYRGVPNRIDASSVEKMVAKYSEDFKVRVTPHKLRHTLATRLYDATKSQVLVSHQLGHASTQVTDLYTHIVNDEQKNALDNL